MLYPNFYLSDMTAEDIEAINPTEYQKIRLLAAELHEDTPRVLALLSAKDIEEEEILRRALMLKLDESMSEVSKEISNLEALKKELRIRKGYASSDRDRMESYKIGVYVQEKQLRNKF